MANASGERGDMTTTGERGWSRNREVQEFAGVGRTALRASVSRGVIPAAKIGRPIRISERGSSEYMGGQNCANVGRR
jgi:hypothetical protein